jgi:predicted RNA-binding Zn-ribbon protein involved in translation (DUF1610 family)
MNTIVIPVNKNRPEDDILNLAELLAGQFRDQTLTVSDALVITTDIPEAAAIFRKIAGSEIVTDNGKKPKTNYKCPECGNPVSHKGSKCRSCSQRDRQAAKTSENSEE